MSTPNHDATKPQNQEAAFTEASHATPVASGLSELCDQLLGNLQQQISKDCDWAKGLSATLTLVGEKLPDLVKGSFYVWKQDKLELGANIGQASPQEIRGGFGLLGSAVSLRSTVLRADTPEHESEIALPVLAGNKLLGVLDLRSRIGNRFSDSDREHLQRFAAALSNLIPWPEEIGVEAEHSTSIRD